MTSPTTHASSPTLYSLQIGRAFAVLLVILLHNKLATQDFLAPVTGSAVWLTSHAGLGVQYFFILSGFIIFHASHKLTATKHDVIYYLKSRCIRIFVPYWPIVIALIALLYAVPSLSQAGSERSYDLWASLLLYPSNGDMVLYPAWTLRHELFFYLLFAVCYFGLRQWKLLYLWLIPIMIGMFYDLPQYATILIGDINLCFLLGLSAYAAYSKSVFKAQRLAMLLLGSLVLVGYGVLSWHEQAVHFLLPCIGLMLIMLALVYYEDKIAFSRYRLLLLVGASSYAIYLLHIPINSVAGRLIAYLPIHSWQGGMIYFTAASLISGCFYFIFYERPALKQAKKHLL